jgi:hypothetical protein
MRGAAEAICTSRCRDKVVPDPVGEHLCLNVPADGLRGSLDEGDHLLGLHDVAFARRSRAKHAIGRPDANHRGSVAEAGRVGDQDRMAIDQDRHEVGEAFGVGLRVGR